jgi:hypothetical protein
VPRFRGLIEIATRQGLPTTALRGSETGWIDGGFVAAA